MTAESMSDHTDVNTVVSTLEAEVNALKAELKAKKEFERNEVISEIAELAKELDEDFDIEEAKEMPMASLRLFKKQYGKLIDIRNRAKNQEANFVDRTQAQKYEELSNYEVFDKCVDIVSKMWNLPILDEEHKQNVRYQHLAEGIEY